jgi:hypothetical protein
VKEPCNFKGGSVDYGPKSICGTEWNLFEIMQDRNKGFWSINRNHQSFGYSSLIQGGFTCLIFRQPRVHDAMLFPVILKASIQRRVLSFLYQISSDNPQKDNFHKVFF